MKLKHAIIVLALAAVSSGILATAKSNVKQPDTYAYQRGVEAYNEDKYQDALDWFNKELQDHPDNGYAYAYISGVRFGNQEYGKALSAINEAVKRIPKKDVEWIAMVYETRAGIYVAMQDTVNALKDLASAIKLDPSNIRILNNRAGFYFNQGRYDLADLDYKTMIQLDEGDVMGYMGVGRNAKVQQKWDDAISTFSYVIKMEPEYSSGYSFRAECYIAKEMWNEATDDIVKALDIDGDDKAFYHMQNMRGESIDLMKSKLKIQMTKQPTNRYWPYCLATIEDTNENYDEAISYYEQGNSIDANSVFLEKIARCYANKNDFYKALDYADRALAMNPDDYDVIELKGDILSNLGRYDECLVERYKVIAKFPENPFNYIKRAEDLMNARRYDSASDDYTTATVLLPALADYPYLLMKRGDAYRLAGSQDKAVKDYKRLLEVEADSVLSSESWTPFAYSGLGNAEKAVETMHDILSNDTTDVKGNLYNMACIYCRLGEKEKAMEYISKAIEKGYDSWQHISVDYDLDCIRELPGYVALMDSVRPAAKILIEDEYELSVDSMYVVPVEVPFTKEGGVTKVKCSINGLPLHFVFDTGASEVTMSMIEANFMLKNDYIKRDDIIGSARYVDANGDVTEGTVINLRKVNFGGLELDNVRASVVRNQKAPLLLGQSVLGRLGKIEIDNPGMKLVITHNR